MTDQIAEASLQKTEKATGGTFLGVIITTILKWIWLLLKGANAPQMNKSEKFWDMISHDFDRQAKAGKAEQTHIKIIESVKQHLKVSDTVLDYGCATGNVAIEIADHVKEVHGIDISSQMIEAAKRKAAERNIENVDFAQATLFDSRDTKASYDVILSLNVLHLVEDTQQVMQRIHELLKPEGIFISSTECMGEKKSLINMLLSLLIKIGIVPSMRSFKVAELDNSITHANFQIVETENFYTFGSQPNHFIVAKRSAT